MTKGQLTIFMVVGVILLAGVIMVSYIASRTSETTIGVPSDWVDSVRIYTEECIDQASMDSVYLIASKGGYYNLSSSYFNMTVAGVNYSMGYVFNDSATPKNMTISINEMEKELSYAMEERFESCIGSYDEFSNLDIEYSDPITDAHIYNESVKIDLDYDVVIRLEERETRISDFRGRTIPVRLGYLRDISDEIANMAIIDSSVNLTYLNDLKIEDNINTYYAFYDNPPEKVYYYIMGDYESSIRSGNSVSEPSLSNQPFLYAFALDFS